MSSSHYFKILYILPFLLKNMDFLSRFFRILSYFHYILPQPFLFINNGIHLSFQILILSKDITRLLLHVMILKRYPNIFIKHYITWAFFPILHGSLEVVLLSIALFGHLSNPLVSFHRLSSWLVAQKVLIIYIKIHWLHGTNPVSKFKLKNISCSLWKFKSTKLFFVNQWLGSRRGN